MEERLITLYVYNDNTNDLFGVKLSFNNHIHFTTDFRYYALDCILQIAVSKTTRNSMAKDFLKNCEAQCKDGWLRKIEINVSKYDEIKNFFGISYFEFSIMQFEEIMNFVRLREF